MKVHVIWPVLLAGCSAVLLAVVLYQKSWVPDYGEAEPLYPVVAEFGRELAEMGKSGEVTPTEIATLLEEERFARIRPYGVVFSSDSEVVVTVRVNKRFSFEVSPEGRALWKTDR